MKSILLTLTALFSLGAHAHEFHTPNYCHPEVKNFCAHIGYHAEPKVNEAFEFVIDIVATPEALDEVQAVQVDLIMPEMGHGSAPVKIERLDQKHFQVTDAYFTMSGNWLVKVEVMTKAGGSMLLEIPFPVK